MAVAPVVDMPVLDRITKSLAVPRFIVEGLAANTAYPDKPSTKAITNALITTLLDIFIYFLFF